MSTPEILRGYSQFREVNSKGGKAHAIFLRGSYLVRGDVAGSVRVGFSVPRNAGKAVDRNRVKRLLRQAIRVIEPGFRSALCDRGVSMDLVLQFRGGRAIPINRVSFQQILDDVTSVCRTILLHLNGRQA